MSTALRSQGNKPDWLARLDPTFRLDPGPHLYTLRDKEIPGISYILKSCGLVDVRYYTESARYRGQEVHRAIHYLNEGDLHWPSVPKLFMGYVRAYERLIKDWNFRLTFCEIPLYHPTFLFGGTPDLVGTVLDNIPAIIELKTGPMPKWAALQTAAQDLLVRAWEGSNTPRRRRWGVTLNEDGTYSKPKEFTDFSRDEATFRMLNTVVQKLGDQTPFVFEMLKAFTPDVRCAIGTMIPTLNAVMEQRELYAA